MEQNGWTIEETRELFNLASKVTSEGKGLRFAFEEMAKKTGRKANSVRNYYYAQAKTFSLLPEMSKKLGIKSFSPPKKADFVAFSPKEVENLISTILIEQAKGRSVRAITYELAHNDPVIMLRLQNKYRSMIFNKKGYAEKKIATLKQQGETFYNPITKQIVYKGVEKTAQEEPKDTDLKNFLGNLAKLMSMLEAK